MKDSLKATFVKIYQNFDQQNFTYLIKFLTNLVKDSLNCTIKI